MKIELIEGYDSVEVIIKCPKATEDIRKLESLLYGYAKNSLVLREALHI